MKSIKSISDAQAAIRDLYNRLDLIQSKNFDMHKKRIVNAHPSINWYDYVVRKELYDMFGKGAPNVIASTAIGGYEKIVFGIGINDYIAIGDDVCPHYISLFSLKPEICCAKVKNAPTGSTVLAQVYLNGVIPIFSSNITIPIGSTAVQVKNDFTISAVNFTDILTVNITQKGSTLPGTDLTIYMRLKITGVPNG